MKQSGNSILTINGGSSSLKFSVYERGDTPRGILSGEIAGLGKTGALLRFTDRIDNKDGELPMPEGSIINSFLFLLDWLEKQSGFEQVEAVGHRIVHGMHHTKPVLITKSLIDELKGISSYDPDHLPAEIQFIELLQDRYPSMQQIACFDTSFHSTMPDVASVLPLPAEIRDKGVRRYGFHGLSYDYLISELRNIAGGEVAEGKVIIAHLGSGASLAAIKNGISIDTSMGFTPVSGIPMSSRPGDMDPSVAWWLMEKENYSAAAYSKLINHDAGLKGLSGISADMKELLKLRSTNQNAALAVEFFCYQVKKWIGAYAAALGGVDTLIFAGGMGERSAEIRQLICEGLEFLGIVLHQHANKKNEPVISSFKERVAVRVMKTNEELMIATLVSKIFQQVQM